MQGQLIIRILGILLLLFSITMLPPILIAMIYRDGGGMAFVTGFLFSFIAGLLLFLPKKQVRGELRMRDGFLTVALSWSVLSLFGAVPFYLGEITNMSLADSVFESFSGLTTTGATVIIGLDVLPHSVLFYRQQLQWLGGMGVLVLAVAILPMLGVGGMQFYRAEAPGPVKDTTLTLRVAGTAKALWTLYLGLTTACALSYWGAGMTLFDAICHSFSTVATGGFSTHDANIGWFNSSNIQLICTFFMLISGANFSLHFAATRNLSLTPYGKDTEFHTFIAVLFSVTLVCWLLLFFQHDIPISKAIVDALFHTVSMATTSGFTSANFAVWPAFLPVLLLLVGFIGGCAGSTGGGIKVVRFLLLLKHGAREVKKLIHPNALFKIRIGKNPLSENIVEAVWVFFATYMALFFLFMLLLMADGLDPTSAFSAVAACMNNLGPGLGEVAANYASISDLSKWLLSIAMLFGRLEIFTLLVLFSPHFWRS